MTTVMIDAECGLCTRLCSFVHPRLVDVDSVRFVGLDTAAAKAALGDLHAHVVGIDTMVVLEGGEMLLRSSAALALASRMRLPWRILSALGVVPARVRDAIYGFVARRRRWFGEAVDCPVGHSLPPG